MSRALDAPCAVLSWVLPLAVGLWSLTGEAGFRDDLGVVRDLGFARIDLQGVVSTVATQVLALLPVGGRALRASLLGVMALALASRCFFGLLLAVLDRRGRGQSHPVLAWIGSSFWALGPVALSEAARIGGALPAVALLLAGASAGRIAFERAEAAALAGAGVLLGATLAESHGAGIFLAIVLACLASVEANRAWTEDAWRLLGSAAASVVALVSLRWFWPASAPDLTLAAGASILPPSLARSEGLGPLETVMQASALLAHELGGATSALALAGALLASGVARVRRLLGALSLPLLVAAFAPLASGASPDSAPLFTLLASLGATACAPVALQTLLHWTWRSPLPFGRPAAVLTLTFATTLVLSRLDRAGLADGPAPRAAAAWTNEALGRLPPASVLCVQSPALAFRLLASRTLHDTRPDVVLVPAGPLTHSPLTLDVTRVAPNAAPLLRQLWVNGVADENSLSRLADERPVFVELDPSWDRWLLEHLRPDGLWLRYSTPAPRVAARRAAASSSRAALLRVLGDVASVEPTGNGVTAAALALDRDTRRALGDAVARQGVALAALAEPRPAGLLLRAARRIDPDNPLVPGLAAQLAEPARGRVAAADLLE